MFKVRLKNHHNIFLVRLVGHIFVKHNSVGHIFVKHNSVGHIFVKHNPVDLFFAEVPPKLRSKTIFESQDSVSDDVEAAREGFILTVME